MPVGYLIVSGVCYNGISPDAIPEIFPLIPELLLIVTPNMEHLSNK